MPVPLPRMPWSRARREAPLPPYPRVAPDVVVESAHDALYRVRRGDRSALLGPEAGRLLTGLDGTRDHDEIAVELGSLCTVERLRVVLRGLHELGCLDDAPAGRHARR